LYAATSLIVIGFFSFLSWDAFSSYQNDHSSERENAAQHQADASHSGVDPCGAVMGEFGIFDWFTCLANVVNTDGGEKQAEYDLKAQQDMAAWAFGMLIVTVWLAVITFMGVLFVWRTLVATREMAKETTRIGEAQVRAYVSFEIKKVDFRAPELAPDNTDIPKPNIIVEIVGSVLNQGQSPASEISFNYTIDTITPFQETGIDTAKSLQNSMSVTHGIQSQGFFENQSLKRCFFADLESLRSKEKLVYFVVVAKWKDVFGRENWSAPTFGTIEFSADRDGNRRVFYGNIIDRGITDHQS
jgi:hypothetical protein